MRPRNGADVLRTRNSSFRYTDLLDVAKALGSVEAVANFRERAAGDLQKLQFLAGCVPPVSFYNIGGNRKRCAS
jgi:hypothetical protein